MSAEHRELSALASIHIMEYEREFLLHIKLPGPYFMIGFFARNKIFSNNFKSIPRYFS